MSQCDVQIQLDLQIPLRDGVTLYAAMYRPIDVKSRTFPVLLVRTIYSTQHPYYVELACRFARAGYAVLLVDSRGRYESEGRWEPYRCEVEDGYDTQQWVGSQPWCNGNVGMFGRSYVGYTQILPAHFRNPYVKALVPMANQEDNYGHLRVDGVLQLQNAMNFVWIGSRTNQTIARDDGPIDMDKLYRRLPLISALDDIAERPFYREMVRHSCYDEFWSAYSVKRKYTEVETPAYFMTGWYDNLLHEGFKCFSGWSSQARTAETRARTKLLVGPWTHTTMGSGDPIGDIEFGADAKMDLGAEHLRWFDQRLKNVDTGIDNDPPLRIFVMGDNAWRFENEWPLQRTEFTKFYLHSGGRANSLAGDGELTTTPPRTDEPNDCFTYDLHHPVPTWGGPSMFPSNSGPRDRQSIERREDVLVYTADETSKELEVTGPIHLTLFASSSARDTDFTATLVDVHPNGMAINITEGIGRARFRNSFEQPVLMEPGTVYKLTITLWETSNVFKAGHRIRLEISSSNFPRFERNQNTGHEPGMDAEAIVAEQTIYHDRKNPSSLMLPIIPR